jgi:DNA-binding transcriptional LysR family regulator
MKLTLRQLSYVVAVVEHGSVTAASEHLRISQPAISSVLNEVEQEYKVSLFVRERPHKITPTPVGRQFVVNAKKLLEQAEDFDSQAQSLSTSLKGSVDLGCFTPTAPFIIPVILERLKMYFPNINIKIHEADIDELNKLLSNGHIEMALTYDMQPISAVEFETLTEMRPYALLSANDPLSKQETVTLEELLKRDMVGFDLPVTNQFFMSLFTQRGLRPRIRHTVKGYEMLRSLVALEEGFSIMLMRPSHDQSYTGDQLTYRRISDVVPVTRFGMAFRLHYQPTNLVHTLANVCRDVFATDERIKNFTFQ